MGVKSLTRHPEEPVEADRDRGALDDEAVDEPTGVVDEDVGVEDAGGAETTVADEPAAGVCRRDRRCFFEMRRELDRGLPP